MRVISGSSGKQTMNIAPTIRILRTLTATLLAAFLATTISGCGDSRNEDVSVHDPNFDPTINTAALPVSVMARTGPIVAVRVGQTALLSDNNSYSSSPQPLSYQWSFSARPGGSKAALQNPQGRCLLPVQPAKR